MEIKFKFVLQDYIEPFLKRLLMLPATFSKIYESIFNCSYANTKAHS